MQKRLKDVPILTMQEGWDKEFTLIGTEDHVFMGSLDLSLSLSAVVIIDESLYTIFMLYMGKM
jgi:hypothetical protein